MTITWKREGRVNLASSDGRFVVVSVGNRLYSLLDNKTGKKWGTGEGTQRAAKAKAERILATLDVEPLIGLAEKPVLKPGQPCSACEEAGWYYVGDWSAGYPKRKCAVCKGSGRMERKPDGKWGPAL